MPTFFILSISIHTHHPHFFHSAIPFLTDLFRFNSFIITFFIQIRVAPPQAVVRFCGGVHWRWWGVAVAVRVANSIFTTAGIPAGTFIGPNFLQKIFSGRKIQFFFEKNIFLLNFLQVNLILCSRIPEK